jgi:eukaryotic-like serine/threonine-protein kinase
MSRDEPFIGNGADGSVSEDAEVARVLDEYLVDLEAGRSADPDRLLAEHPAIASQLRGCLEVMHLAGRVAGSGDVASDGEDDAPPGPRLADYRIIRQVGRGGMGIVYEAEQQSLRRRVALKVLPLASAIDPRQLRRFHVEAQAAAQLHHTHIVPVYAVGCERGVHYYAMQYIEGKTLAELIRELRQLEGPGAAEEVSTAIVGEDLGLAGMLASGRLAPYESPIAAPTAPAASRSRSGTSARTSAYVRTVANLGIQAAEALEHAHQEGIVHRDIKPANLMVDVKGHLWITDFGLARLHNESGLTLSGDLVGTIRYMSPEQANGRNALVDHRTDIYSLGVTLYELLTLGPAYEGGDRRELLRRIIEEAPTPLRSIVSGVPRELETIIQKATAREPESRYRTAQELADDLRRFLDHRPIQARRPSLWTRARKMVRRHRIAVTAAAAMLLILGLAGAMILTQRHRNRTLEQTERSRRYVEDIQAASHLIEKCHLDEARRMLAGYLPRPGDDDIRSFAWFQLWRVCTYQPTVWPGHSDAAAKEIFHVEISPRGDVMASSGQDGTVRLWNAETGQLLRTLQGHNGDVNYVAFSPDGSKLATGGDDGTVRLWSLSGSPNPITLGKHDDWVHCVLFTADGRWVISGGRDGRVKLWDPAHGQMLASVDTHSIEGMALSPDGRTLASGGPDGRIKLWAAESLRPLRDLGPQPRGLQSVAFSHDGSRAAAAGRDCTVDIWDLARGQVVASGRVPTTEGDSAVQCVAFSPDDRTLATCGDDGAVRLWDSATGEPLQTYRAERGRLWCVAFSRDGRSLISCGTGGLLRRWDLAHPQDRSIIRLPHVEAQSIAFAAGSGRLLVAGRPAVAGTRHLTISSWDLSRGVPIDAKQVELEGPLWYARFSADGKTVCTQDERGRHALWDAETGRVVREAPVPGTLIAQSDPTYFCGDKLSFDYYAEKAAKANGTSRSSGTDRPMTPGGRFIPLVRLPESEAILVLTDTGMVTWNPLTDRIMSTALLGGDGPNLVRGAHDGRNLAAGYFFAVRLYDSRTLRPKATLLDHPTDVVDLDFSPDDKVLASVSSDGTVKLWDLTTLQELRTLPTVPAQNQDRFQIRFSPDGSYLVCAVWHNPIGMSELIVWPTARQEDSSP